ncbi:MAG: hypothetical protein V4563_17605 [Pseudomonadota bacterium]
MAGFRYVGSYLGADINGKEKQFAVEAAHTGVLGPGDLVTITGVSTTTGLPAVDIAGVGAFTGVVSSIIPNFSGEALSQTWLPALTAGSLLLNVDSKGLYIADVFNGPLVAADVGLNAPSVVTAGTVSGALYTSNMGINSTGKATTATLPWNIVELLADDAGVLGNRALVRANETTSNPGSTGI